MWPDNPNDVTSDTWEVSENITVSKSNYYLSGVSPKSYITTPILCVKHSFNVVILETELVPNNYVHADDELAQSRELWHPTHEKQNITCMS